MMRSKNNKSSSSTGFTTTKKWKSVLLVALMAHVAGKTMTRRRMFIKGGREVMFRSSAVDSERLFSSSTSSSSSLTTTTEILAVVTVGWEISSSNERKAHLRRIIDNYREMCNVATDNDAEPQFKRVTVAVAAYEFDEESLIAFLSSSSYEHFFRSSRRNGDWQITVEKEKSSDDGRVTIERIERAVKMSYTKKSGPLSLPCEFAVDLELFGLREIDGTKSYLTPGDLAIRHRDIFLRRILSNCEECDVESSDKVLFVVQEDDVYLDKKHVSLFLETSKLTERVNKFEEMEGIFYHPFFFDYEKDSDDIVYADWRVNAGIVQKWKNNQTIFTSAKASGGGRSLMIRGRSRLQELLFSTESSSSVVETRVSELREWLDPLAAHPGEFNVEVATNRWIERKIRAHVSRTKVRKQARFLLPLSFGGDGAENRTGSLETLLDSAGIWHASNTYVERRKELLPLDPSSANKKNRDTLERLRLDELQQIFRSCVAQEGKEGEEQNECFRCLSAVKSTQESEKRTVAASRPVAEYRARVFVDDDENENYVENQQQQRQQQQQQQKQQKRRRRIDVVFSCA